MTNTYEANGGDGNGDDDLHLRFRSDSDRQILGMTVSADDSAATTTGNALLLNKKNNKASTSSSSTSITIVQVLKRLILVTLVLAAIIVSMMIFWYNKKEETKQFEVDYEQISNQFFLSIQQTFHEQLESLHMWSIMIETYVTTTTSTSGTSGWPFITIPLWEEYYWATKSLTKASTIILIPILTGNWEQRINWESYSIQNKHWINESYSIQKNLLGEVDVVDDVVIEDDDPKVAAWGEGEGSSSTTSSSSSSTYDEPDFSLGMASQIFHQVSSVPSSSNNTTSTTPTDNDNNELLQLQVVEYNKDGPFFPQWQISNISPYHQGRVNYNLGSNDEFYNASIHGLLSSSGRSSNGHVVMISSSLPSIATTTTMESSSNDDNNNMMMGATLLYPITDLVSGSIVAELACQFTWNDYFTTILQSLSTSLGSSTSTLLGSMDLVVKNRYSGQLMTYRLLDEDENENGSSSSSVTFIGHGDHHDTNLQQYQQYMILGNDHDTNSMKLYTGSKLHLDYTYELYIYPTRQFQNLYVTRTPMAYTILIVIIFTSCFILFVIYDYLIERRHTTIVKSAIQSDAVVSSLFPNSVKEQLYNQHQQQQQQNGATTTSTTAASNNIGGTAATATTTTRRARRRNSNNSDTYSQSVIGMNRLIACRRNSNATENSTSCHDDSLNEGSTNNNDTTTTTTNNKNWITRRRNSNNNTTDDMMEGWNNNNQTSDYHPTTTTTEEDNTSSSGGGGGYALHPPPIAELYPETTILFADIAGFTQWSSDREPTHVFTLLETLYGAFDKAAKERHVFKVETIGDCYVAVTGIPKPRKDHAVSMVKFAADMLLIMNEKRMELVGILGEDTQHLALRVGIHSGPVTAGVLRGEKARFQLFGDSVNTTARHESSGKPNRIHGSITTAQLLIDAGKAHWVQPRKTRIFAKGKGELKTFWLVPNNNVYVTADDDSAIICTTDSSLWNNWSRPVVDAFNGICGRTA